jgi:hypothetical protein
MIRRTLATIGVSPIDGVNASTPAQPIRQSKSKLCDPLSCCPPMSAQ